MLEVVGQFGLHYRDQSQGTLGSLVATPSLLSRVIERSGTIGRSKRGYPQGVPLLSFCCASKWKENVP